MSFKDALSQSPLGKSTDNSLSYSPDILVPIPRQRYTDKHAVQMCGDDIWNAYEFFFCDAQGKARVGQLQLSFSVDSPHIVESKSLKLYLNTYYNQRFQTLDACLAQVKRDLDNCLQTDCSIRFIALSEAGTSAMPAHYLCLDERVETITDTGLQLDELLVNETLYTHCFRSLCPVTSQPDFATILIQYEGKKLNEAALLGYLLSFADHQGFHEACVEEIFLALGRVSDFSQLCVQGLFTRRGGIDINPFRSKQKQDALFFRSSRQ